MLGTYHQPGPTKKNKVSSNAYPLADQNQQSLDPSKRHTMMFIRSFRRFQKTVKGDVDARMPTADHAEKLSVPCKSARNI
jgi:hypothetical protein